MSDPQYPYYHPDNARTGNPPIPLQPPQPAPYPPHFQQYYDPGQYPATYTGSPSQAPPGIAYSVERPPGHSHPAHISEQHYPAVSYQQYRGVSPIPYAQTAAVQGYPQPASGAHTLSPYPQASQPYSPGYANPNPLLDNPPATFAHSPIQSSPVPSAYPAAYPYHPSPTVHQGQVLNNSPPFASPPVKSEVTTPTSVYKPLPNLKITLKRPQASSHSPNSTIDPARLASDTTSTMASGRRSSHPVHQMDTTPVASTSGRPVRASRLQAQVNIKQSVGSEDDEEDEVFGEESRVSRSGRVSKPPQRYAQESDFENRMMETSPMRGHDEEYEQKPTRGGRTKKVILDPDEEDDDIPAPPRNAFPPRATRTSGFPNGNAIAEGSNGNGNGNGHDLPDSQDVLVDDSPTTRRTTRSGNRPKSRHSSAGADSFNPTASEGSSEGSMSDDPIGADFIDNDDDYEEEDYAAVRSKPHRAKRYPAPRAPSRSTTTARRTTRRSNRIQHSEEDEVAPTRRLRQRTSKIDYTLPPADISMEIMQEAIASASRPGGSQRSGAGSGRAGGVRFGGVGGKGLPWNVKSRDLARAMGDPDTSDSDDLGMPLKGAAGSSSLAAGGGGRGGNTDVPNFGRINPKSNMADADPLGVDVNVSFDNVGGLDDHINQLKEMVALPLLYPELFQQFGITPPRGVLFHGPPGTGKTLLARALAASCSTGNTKIAFFMRKGADVLSKWVGEAERQLRMLFDEARAAQPSIIFFDEIDGLAPVRSSKQDQIHASLVSTLLALMDGMDGRGQVIVIGATNRPDAVDPALRRPGRFDREFYFPLPNKAARKKIVSINTRNWDPLPSDAMLDRLAGLTKGYGGADLRALCTEAALNAIQRRYPQIYKTTNRLALNAKSIHVQAKDFMLSVKRIVPSSARSTASAAAPLPPHLVPLLGSSLDRLKTAIDLILPAKKSTTALEEAEFEEEEGDSFEKHGMMQSLDKLRTFRPRLAVYGRSGMGQSYLGPAILHHLEGFHVQSLDLGSLMGDSTRTVEAGLVQLFVEAKRHQPSVIFIPSLAQWSSAVSETARSTMKALLDGVPASDPVLLLAVVDGSFYSLPRDVRSWFGLGRENKFELEAPFKSKRETYFAELLSTLKMPPTAFPDALPRRKRILEELPLAPPLPPRQPTEAELARDAERDLQAREMMILSFTGLVQEFMRKFRKVVASVRDDAMELTRLLEEDLAASNPNSQSLPDGQANGPSIGSDPSDPINSIPAGTLPSETSSLPPLTDSHPSNPFASAIQPIQVPSVPQDSIATESTLPVPAQPEESTLTPTSKVWQAHPIDIDVISLKLNKHKYLVPADFLADIAKIEDNANHLGDPERITKISEMGANARMHVTGFDPAWAPRFEAYAERVRERKAKRQKAKAAAVTDGEATVSIDESRNTDVATGGPGVEPQVGSFSQKRGREEDMDGGIIRAEKRPREGDVPDLGDIASTAQALMAQPIQPIAGPSTATPQPLTHLPSTLAIQPTSSALEPPPSATSPLTPLATEIPTVPPPKYPPFVLPAEQFASLSQTLLEATEDFTIDELEQLRAACYDRIWRARGAWDKTQVIKDVMEVVEGLREEVEMLREEEEREE